MIRRVTMLAVLAMLVSIMPASAALAQRSGDKLPIPTPEVNESLPPGLIQYSDVAAVLNDITRKSDRVSAEVIGQSAGGRDLYMATVSDPDANREETKAIRELMLKDPEAAQELAASFDDFRVPVMVNCSIHGNEYEGVDACLQVIELLAFDDSPETQAILDNVILLVNVVQNPDGRVLNTRANANGFDVNRDFATNSQPESISTRDIMVEWNPMVFLDLHGYVNNMLIEPTTPPHNPNYEYDLYIENAYANALAMEQGVLNAYQTLKNDPDFADDYAEYIEPFLASEEQVVIPFRDWDVGDWDDYPPIFAPMYAMYHGAYGATLESPLSSRGGTLERQEARATVNQAAHYGAVMYSLNYVVENKVKMITDQLEIFVRGNGGVPPVPVDPSLVPGWGDEDVYVADFPEAYIIPIGEGQASDLAAAQVVDHLIDNGVAVGRTNRGFTFDGQYIEAGSYYVTMSQARRGLVNTYLETGTDITYRTPQMYDISGWSQGALWGATVITVPLDTGLRPRTTPARSAEVQGSVPEGSHAAYSYEMDSEVAIRATNALLADGVALRIGGDGTIVVPGDAAASLAAHAADGIVFTALAELSDDLETLEQVDIAASLGGDELFTLNRLGFSYEYVQEADINSGETDLSAFDVLMVSSGFNYNSLDDAGKAALTGFLSSGGGVVTINSSGADFSVDAGLLDVTVNEGPNCAGANGIVQVDNNPDSVVTAGFEAADRSFVYDPLWFTDLGEGVVVDQSYDAVDPLISGHWLGDYEDWVGDTEPGGPNCGRAGENNSQQDAAGLPSVVSGVDETGARVVLFGTEPLFRAHPVKVFQELAQAVYWTSAG